MIRKSIGLMASVLISAVMLTGIPLLAVSTSHWVHQSEADFKPGTLHNVVVTNLGDVKLSRAIKSIEGEDPDVSSVNALAQGPGGIVYAGTGPKGILLSVDSSGKVTRAATIDGAVNILSLLADSDGSLLIGTGGEKGRILKIARPGGEAKEIYSDADVQYIWALQQTPDGNVYAATGPVGKVVEIKPDGSHSVIYKSAEDNITSMISDGKDTLYLGTDPNGLVVRLDRKTRNAFVLYNAAESEVTGLALDSAGNLYAATGEVSDRQSQPQPAAETQPKTSGRPEETPPAAPIPPVPNPAPPAPVPNPNPGEPKPIPKKQGMLNVGSSAPKFMDAASMDDPEPDPNPGGGGGGDNPGEPGGDQPTPGTVQSGGAQKPTLIPPTPGPSDQSQKPEGNAIYKIDKDGFVTEIFRENEVIYSLVLQGDVLLVGTGDDGNIYQVNPQAEETEVVAKVDAKQVMCLLPTKDGVLIGLANTGGISELTGGYASSGTYISPVLDATQVSRFGQINLHGQLPDRTRLQIATRSGNVKDADAVGWSDWSGNVAAVEYQKVLAPSARFLQYRLTFETADSSKSALVDHVDVAYQIPNLAPAVKSLKIGSGGDTESTQTEAAGTGPTPPGASTPHADPSAKPSGGTATQTITWDASDANNDPLVYTLYFRLEEQGPWILLKDDLKDTSYDWDTKAVADGRYQIKVVASDAASNPLGDGKTGSRVSDFYVVDNTPPTIGDLTWKTAGNDVNVDFRALDQTSPIASAEFTVDSSDNWQSVFPVDNIFDNPNEEVRFTLKGLTPGQHQVTIRVSDSRGNQALQTVFVKVDASAP